MDTGRQRGQPRRLRPGHSADPGPDEPKCVSAQAEEGGSRARRAWSQGHMRGEAGMRFCCCVFRCEALDV